MLAKSLICIYFCWCLNPVIGRRATSDREQQVEYFDLAYSLSSNTIFYPGAKPYQLTKDAEGWRENGSYWYSSFSFCMGEHGGTHLDAPYHFYKEGWTVDQIPPSHLINIPVTVVNVQEQVESMSIPGNFKLTVAHLMGHEKERKKIESKSLVLIYTGWSKFWPNRTRYLGIEEDGTPQILRFPGLSEGAIKWLSEERQIVGLGIDTPSVDQGLDSRYPVHVYGASRQIYNLENVANLHLLTGKTETNLRGFVLPLKIVEGTGAPVRILVQTS